MKLTFTVVLLLSLAVGSAGGTTIQYTVTDLGTLGGLRRKLRLRN